MNKPFCQAPWSHIFIDNNGKVYPCVFSVGGESFGDLNSDTLEHIWTKKFVHLRENFSNNISLPACSFCLNNEANQNKSMRTLINAQSPIYSEAGPRFVGIKFSNVCNLKCRICNPSFSSAWAEELGLDKKSVNTLPHNFIEKISSALNVADFFHFTGGEPLLSSQHLQFLDWLKINRPDSTLTYNTNLTQLYFGKRSFIQEWSSFKKVYINFSIDGWGDRAEYLRTGTKWIDIENNITKLKSASNVEIIYYITIYAQNIMHLPDLINNIRESFGATAPQFFLNYLSNPAHFHISSTHPDFRPEIIRNIERLQKSLFQSEGASALSLITQLTSVNTLLKKDYRHGQWEKALDEILKSQPIGMNFMDYFPEFYSAQEKTL